jgi:hypothetical protein
MKTPIEKFLEKYQNNMIFEYIKFKPKEPIKVVWWGVQKITIIKDANTGEPTDVVQLLVKTEDDKYKIISTTSVSLLKQLAEIQKRFKPQMGSILTITQFRESSTSGRFKTYYKVEEVSNTFVVQPPDKEAEQLFLYGITEEIE